MTHNYSAYPMLREAKNLVEKGKLGKVLLTNVEYPQGYTVGIKKKDEKSTLIKGLVGHDPVINFIILKSFWMKGFIKGDHILEKVMKMEIEDYMKKLQKNYR